MSSDERGISAWQADLAPGAYVVLCVRDDGTGEGTIVNILLPSVTEQVDPIPRLESSRPVGGHEVVVVVEDESMVRDIAARILRRLGYDVVEASDGEEALAIIGASPRPIDLVISDVIMPNMGGRELVDRLRSTHPSLKVLLTSGYTAGAITRDGRLEPNLAFLPKPYTPTKLAAAVRELLDDEGRD